jgi:S-DNA-T family DNA segregation ATPase FtsK/SpoIIIE
VAQRPSGSSRGQRSSRSRAAEPSSARRAVSGHEADLVGLGLIVVAVVLGLGVYIGAAGVVGEGLDAIFAGLVGVGRYLLPPALIVVGVLLIHDGKVANRNRIILGCILAAVGLLALLHVAAGPSDFPGGYDDVKDDGGWFGGLFGAPLRRLIGSAGAVVVTGALILAAVVIITRVPLKRLAERAGHGMRVGFRPAIGAAGRAIKEMATLSSDKERAAGDADVTADPEPDSDVELPPPVVSSALYDLDTEEPTRPRKSPSGASPASPLPPPDPAEATAAVGQLQIDLGGAGKPSAWKLPPASLLGRTAAQTVDTKMVEERGRVLEGALASHGVETRLVGMTVGPTVTRYELELGPGVKVARVTSLNKDIAYAMASPDVRILAPIPGRSAIGVEVPNQSRHLVSLGDILATPEAKKATHPLEVAVGRDIAGRAVMMNLATMPHLLVAGATGAGKSSCINCIVTSLLMRSTPDQVRLILIDPKRVEMGQYNRLPHLLTQVVTNPKKAANALQWAVKEMERRYDLLHEVGVRDITGYNAAFDRGELGPGGRGSRGDRVEPGSERIYERLPFVVVVVDELNDLMMVAARDVEDSITRIAQMARAVGLHLVVATQRPSVNVLTGVIKANIPARMAFAVSSLTDSRVILDQPGAERLVGKGDLLLLGPASSVAQRIQGAWVSEDEVRKVVGHWRRQAPEPVYVSGVEGSDDGPGGLGSFGGGEDADDEVLVRQAMELVVRSQLGSTSMLQRKLKVGFARAGRLMDLLEQRGVVGPSEGSKARAVLMTPEELDLILDAERSGA